jgi:cell division protein FtsZ
MKDRAMNNDYIDDDFITPDDWKPNDKMIKVIGVGGCGCNAVTYMYNQQIEGCTFIVCNTDAQSLESSNVPIKLRLGEGLGAGTDHIKGRNCAINSQSEIEARVLGSETKMLFITAGMGGGTGTGAAPIIAKMAKDKGILTVAVVTFPFKNERNDSYSKAVDGVKELQKNVDSLIIIDNEKLASVYKNELLQNGFPKSDDILATAVRGVTEIIKVSGYKNVDFEDVKTIMQNSEVALMGSGEGCGEKRLEEAVEKALNSPLLYDFELKSSQRALINITVPYSDQGITMEDLTKLNEMIDEHIGDPSKYKEGIVFNSDPEWGDKVRVTIIATGFKMTRLSEVIGENRGNIINIHEDFVYIPEQHKHEESDSPYEEMEKIGFNTISNEKKFQHFSEAPALYTNNATEKQKLESIPAIRRRSSKKEN